MISLKARGHRSSSTLVSSLIHNKENTLDLGNRQLKRPAKLARKESTNDSLNIQRKLPEQLKVPNIVRLKPAMAEVSPLDSPPKSIKDIQTKVIAESYSEDVLNTLQNAEKTGKLSNILTEHQISKELRAKMVDWIIEVISSYKYSEAAFFTAVRIMDTFFMKTKQTHKSSDLHLVGVAAIFISCKYEEIYPLKVKLIHQKIAHKKLSKEEIIRKESQIMAVLNFDLVGVNNFEILQQTLYMANIPLSSKHAKYLTKITLYLSKMIMFDVDLISTYDYSTLAAASIYVAFKIIEQVEASFSPDLHIKDVFKVLKVNESVSMEASGKVLALAKSFDKHYPSLHNLRKFNGFSSSTNEGSMTERPNQ